MISTGGRHVHMSRDLSTGRGPGLRVFGLEVLRVQGARTAPRAGVVLPVRQHEQGVEVVPAPGRRLGPAQGPGQGLEVLVLPRDHDQLVGQFPGAHVRADRLRELLVRLHAVVHVYRQRELLGRGRQRLHGAQHGLPLAFRLPSVQPVGRREAAVLPEERLDEGRPPKALGRAVRLGVVGFVAVAHEQYGGTGVAERKERAAVRARRQRGAAQTVVRAAHPARERHQGRRRRRGHEERAEAEARGEPLPRRVRGPVHRRRRHVDRGVRRPLQLDERRLALRALDDARQAGVAAALRAAAHPDGRVRRAARRVHVVAARQRRHRFARRRAA
mmetsp:Transcript_11429/g.34099  ORF Transcript_11429/g.34099 Transcript_11429/m.34099 type:complete len:330 (+) Transcript_11429:27-1016(+)